MSLLRCACGHVKGDHQSGCAETTRGTYAKSACGACDCQQWRPQQPEIPQELDAITDVVLAYRPKPKSKGAKRRTRRAKKAAKDAEDG